VGHVYPWTGVSVNLHYKNPPMCVVLTLATLGTQDEDKQKYKTKKHNTENWKDEQHKQRVWDGMSQTESEMVCHRQRVRWYVTDRECEISWDGMSTWLVTYSWSQIYHPSFSSHFVNSLEVKSGKTNVRKGCVIFTRIGPMEPTFVGVMYVRSCTKIH
jgi:hypothetical protein